MSNLAQNDVLETGMEINDASDDSRRWDPFTLHKVKREWTRIKVYIRENFSPWKATMTVLIIIAFALLIYIAEFVGQIRNLNGKKNQTNP